MKKEYDLLIVGAGIYGATAAYRAKQEGKKCLVCHLSPLEAVEYQKFVKV